MIPGTSCVRFVFSYFLILLFFLPCKLSDVLACFCSAFVFIALGTAWLSNLAVFAMCLSVLKLVIIELVSRGGGICTDTGYAGYIRAEMSFERQDHTHLVKCLGASSTLRNGRTNIPRLVHRSRKVFHPP